MSCTFPVCLFIYLFWQAATNKWTSDEHCCLILGQPGMLCHGRDSILPLTSQAIVKEWFRNIWIVIETSFQEIKTTLCRFQPDSRLLRCVVLQTALTDNLLIWCAAFVNAQGGEKRPSIPGHNALHWKRSASATSFLLTSFPAVMFRRPDFFFLFLLVPPKEERRLLLLLHSASADSGTRAAVPPVIFNSQHLLSNCSEEHLSRRALRASAIVFRLQSRSAGNTSQTTLTHALPLFWWML